MALFETLSPPAERADQDYYFDSKFVQFKNFLAISYLEGKSLREIPRKETTLYLQSFSRKPIEPQAPIHSAVSLKNNSDFTIINFSILCRESRKRIFHLNELAPKKIIQLEFAQKGVFDLFYSFAWDQKIEKRRLKIIQKPDAKSSIPHNFHPDLKPSWWI
ncbi:MAG: hypothetical protein ACE5EK_04360 [Nitrospinales bacterium]